MRYGNGTKRTGLPIRGLAAAAGAILAAFACSETSGPPTSLDGAWGGPHFGLDVAADSAHTRFDCAHGSIEMPIRLDRNGAFSAPGEYVADVGPIPPFEATYDGAVHGDRLDLRVLVRLPASAEPDTLGPFTATRNGDAEVIYCR